MQTVIEEWYTRRRCGVGLDSTVEDLDRLLAELPASLDNWNRVARSLRWTLQCNMEDLLERLSPDGFVDDGHPTPLEVYEYLTPLMSQPKEWVKEVFDDHFGTEDWDKYTYAWEQAG